MATQNAVSHRVKGPPPHLADVEGHQGAHPIKHLLGGLVGEGQEEDVARLDSLVQKVGHPVGQGPRLSRSGSCDHQ